MEITRAFWFSIKWSFWVGVANYILYIGWDRDAFIRGLWVAGVTFAGTVILNWPWRETLHWMTRPR